MQMALLPSPTFHKMKSVFLKYEEGKLKNQKPPKVSKQSFQKLIEGKYAAKLTHFKIFQGLQVKYNLVFISCSLYVTHFGL